MAAAFFSESTAVLQREVQESRHGNTPVCDLSQVYELPACVSWINVNTYKRVALQFPDDLLCDSSAIARHLGLNTDAKIFILGDTSYGSCCVDEVAAQHHDADAIIHFGYTCLSSTRRLPVLYIFGQISIDASHCAKILSELVGESSKPCLLIYDVRYHHALDLLKEEMDQKFCHLVVGVVNKPGTSLPSQDCLNQDNSQTLKLNQDKILGRQFTLLGGTSLQDYTVLYIGTEGPSLSNWMLTLNNCSFYTYDGPSRIGRKETVSINRRLMQRYYMIEKAKDAKIVGILAGTLGVADYLTIIDRLKKLIHLAGKKSYTFVVGKLNVAKLANFMEVDVFVLVSCPENTLIDSTEFYQPVVTPFEMEIACNHAREWTGNYHIDFRDLLPGSSTYVELPEETPCRADVSLVTGGVRRLGIEMEEDRSSDGQLVTQGPQALSTITTAGEVLAGRSWQGLEQKLGQTPVTKAREGRLGIASGYTEEPHQWDTGVFTNRKLGGRPTLKVYVIKPINEAY